MKPFPSFSLLAASLILTLSARADQTWTGTGDALWSNAMNWTSAVPTSADIAIFDAASMLNLATTLGADQSVAGIRIVNPAGPVAVAATIP